MIPPTHVHVPGFPNSAAARAKLDRAFDARFDHGWTPGIFDPETEMIAVIQERPKAKRLSLASDFKASQIDTLVEQVRQLGFDLVEVDLHEKYAVIAKLDAGQRSIRNRLASFLKCRPWEVEVAVEREDTRVDLVQVLRAPESGIDAEKRLALWRAAVEVIPGGHRDWLVQEDMVSGRVVLTRRDPISLPPIVPLESIIPDSIDPADWASVPFARDGQSREIGQNRKLTPMMLVTGLTGSGKTVQLVSAAVSNLLRGGDLAIIDPTKGGLDFLELEDHCIGFAEDYETATALITAIYAEGVRRKAILKRERKVKWSDLPADVLAAENIRPLMLIIDEVSSTFLLPETPKGLDRDHPLIVAANVLMGQKAIIRDYTGKIARELRFVGIFLCLGTQRPDASILGGELRSNLGCVVQLTAPGKLPSREALTMTFGAQANAAGEVLHALDDGKSPGLAVIADESGDLTAVRIAYAPPENIPAMLRERGVQPVKRWELDLNATKNSLEELDLPDAFDAFGSLAPEAAADTEPSVGDEFIANPIDDDLPDRRGAKRPDPEDDDPFAGFPA